MSTRTTKAPATPARGVDTPDETAHLDVAVPGSTVLVVGRLDVHAAADVRVELARQVVLGSGELVLDLAGVTGVDATGLGLLVGAHRRAGRAGRVLVLQDVPAPVGRLLLLTRLDRVLVQRRTSQAA
jgi:anti-anti-sigma factor